MWMAIVGMALSLVGAMREGQAAKLAGQTEQQMLNMDADSEMENAKQQAKLIRKMGDQQRGQAKGALAKSNIDVNSTTANDVLDFVDQGAEMDAYAALLSGETRARSLRNKGEIAMKAGKDKRDGSYLAGAGKAMNSMGGMGGGS